MQVKDFVAKVARLHAAPKSIKPGNQFSIHNDGTYVITGGLSVLGLEMAEHIAQSGARRIVLVSRRGLPPRHTWNEHKGQMRATQEKVVALEQQGTSVHALKLDICQEGAATVLRAKLSEYPAIRGVIHVAGILEDQLVLETTSGAFSNVLSPRGPRCPRPARGLPALRDARFLRHVQLLPAAAWLPRTSVRRRRQQLPRQPCGGKEVPGVANNAPDAAAHSPSKPELPAPGRERAAYLEQAISECAAKTLQLQGAEDVDPKTALSDLGMDSVMMVTLRKKLQDRLRVHVLPTLIWGHPTVFHLVKWFEGKLS